MQDAVSELTRLTQSIAVDDALDDEDRAAFQQLAAETAQLYFAAPDTLFNPRASFWVVFEGRQRGIFADWGMANEVIFGFSGNSHRKIRGWNAAVQVLTQHLWDLGFRADESPQPVPSARLTTSNSLRAQLVAPPTRSRVANPSRPGPPNPARVVNTQSVAPPTPSRVADSSRTQPTAPPPYISVTPVSLPPALISNLRPPTRPSPRMPVQTADTPVAEALVQRGLDWYVVASSSEITVFYDQHAAERRALDHQDNQDLLRYCRTPRMGSMLDVIEQWAWDHGGT
ncbi:hypothetical protein MSAN_01745500 [Mycena sanguinolenta]|uniref:Ribonuclease H1 N-terminal domain-containing protein n=1 Tax=Mycena sanguinolenta TaxID=230812 RepID=A0A8H6Y0H5_9AGAR|nr:hypothetical protein MSAN_01745500 [Mycena sanguinolenta]